MKRLKAWIKSKLDQWAIERFTMLMPKKLITDLYIKIATKDLKLEERVINVKKGSRRYTLLILKDRNGETVFNLGRHGSTEPYLRATHAA